jgi:prevent-host-death family protein
MTWHLQNAKNKFSQLVQEAQKGDPQIVTRNGKPVVYVIDYDRYHELLATKTPDKKEVLQNRPHRELELDLERIKEQGREGGDGMSSPAGQ